MRKNIFILSVVFLATSLLGGCSSGHSVNLPFLNHQSALPTTEDPEGQIQNPAFWHSDPDVLWQKLQHTPYTQLTSLHFDENSPEAAWVKLAVISKQDSTNTTQLVNNLIAWHHAYPEHPGNRYIPDESGLNAILNHHAPHRIAVLLPLEGQYASLGNAVKEGFNDAAAMTPSEQSIKYYNTGNPADIHRVYQQALAEGADFIVGPLTKEDVQKITGLGTLSEPTLALNYTDIWYGTLPTNLYQFGLSPLDEAKQVADKASQLGHHKALIIAPQDDWGKRVLAALKSRWQADGGSIADVYQFTQTSDLSKGLAAFLNVDTNQDHDTTHATTPPTKEELESRRRQDFDVIFLLASPERARAIVPLLRYYYITDTPIFSTSAVYSGKPDPVKDTDLDGITFCDIPALLQAISPREYARFYSMGHDAYLISSNLPRFIYLPQFPAYGATGALTLDANHQFYRRLAWAQFHDGHP